MTDATAESQPVSGWVSAEAQQMLAASASWAGVVGSPQVSWRDDPEAYAAQRDEADKALAGFLADRVAGRDIAVEDRDVDGVPLYVMTPGKLLSGTEDVAYFYVHGGALVGGGGIACQVMAKMAAVATRLTTWAVDYRLPPKFPYPTPLDDCVSAYRALLEVQRPERIVVGGASAGGNLAAALILRARDEGLPLPTALVLLSPQLDLTERGYSFSVTGRSYMESNLLYSGDHDLSDPHVSPLYAEPHGFPPTFIQSGTADEFLSNSVVMHRKLRALDIDAELHCWEAMPHGGFRGAPEDREVDMELRKWLAKHLS